MPPPRPPPDPSQSPPQIAALARHHPNNVVAPEKPPTHHPPLQQPSPKKPTFRSNKFFRRIRSVFRSFPIITTPCTMPNPVTGNHQHDNHHIYGAKHMTGTLFGHRKTRINLAIQENPKCHPMLLLEMSINTGKLLHDMGLGLVRIALECDKRPLDKTKLMDEPIWTMYSNGRKVGYAVKREATSEDIKVMELLNAVSMGAGVLPNDMDSSSAQQGEGDGDLTYMRAFFERVIGSKDSETYYMINPDGNSGHDQLSIFFVRLS